MVMINGERRKEGKGKTVKVKWKASGKINESGSS